ncbi:MAG: antibiotic biosynthesis monooxygenase [Steroidobacteraceae bacterium]
MEKIFAIVRMKLAPGVTEEFRQRGRACIAAASQDLTGTTAYEWFVSPDGTEAIVIESYDDAEAVALHGKMVGGTVLAVTELAKFAIQFAGDVPEPIIARMRDRLGAADYFGPRFQGRLTSRAAGKVGPNAGTMIFAAARFSIQPGKQDEFRALAREAFARVEANEPGTLGYEWFLNAAGTECLTIDVYKDTAALLAHMANAGPVMAKILQIVKSDTTVYGAVAPEVRAKFKPELGVKFGGEQLGGVM